MTASLLLAGYAACYGAAVLAMLAANRRALRNRLLLRRLLLASDANRRFAVWLAEDHTGAAQDGWRSAEPE